MSRKRVLILDDDPIARDIFARVLKAEGYDVCAAGTAQQAIEAGTTFAPQALVSDWMLKEELSGIDVARTLFEQQPNLKIFFMTGLPAENLRNQLNGMSICKIYEKPTQFDPLLIDLAQVLGPNGDPTPP